MRASKMQKIVDAANSSDSEALGKNAFLKDKIEVVQGKLFLLYNLKLNYFINYLIILFIYIYLHFLFFYRKK